MKRCLIFYTTPKSHYIEYAHHIYSYAKNDFNNEYVFSLPEDDYRNSNYDWSSTNNIRIDVISNDDLHLFNEKNLYVSGFYRTKLLRQRIISHQITNVVLLNIILYLPFLFFFVPSNVKVSGIIYRIYLYVWKQCGLLGKFKEVLMTLLMVHSNVIESIFVLNDTSAVAYFNKIYSTNRFKYIPDPFVSLPYTPKNVREDLINKSNTKIFLHFGGLGDRKGTLTILKAIGLLPEKYKKKCCFVFAGKIVDRDLFFRSYEKVKDKANVVLYEGHQPYEFIYDLVYSSDYILVPYKNTLQSSGLISYGAFFKKVVIGPAEGVLGKLIKRHRMGFVIKNMSPGKLTQILQDCSESKIFVGTSYLAGRSSKQFAEILMNN